MINSDEILDDLRDFQPINNSHVEDQWIVSVPKFIFLSFMTLGIYPIWWMYKEWRFFSQKDGLDILPAARAIFGIFFIFPLFKKINSYSLEKHNSNSVNAGLLTVFILIFAFLGRLPEPFLYITFLGFIPFIPAVSLINELKMKDDDLNVFEIKGFNGKQIFLIILGIILWSLFIMGLFAQETEIENYNY